MWCYAEKSIKWCQHPSKTALKSTLQLGSILEPTWLHFGRVLGAKLGPKSHQIAPQIDLQINKKWSHFGLLLGSIFDDFGLQLGPQEGDKTFTFRLVFALGAILGPTWPQDLSKMPPGIDFRRFGLPTWRILGPNLEDFEPQVDGFGHQTAQLGAFWHPTAEQPISHSTQRPINPIRHSTQQPISPTNQTINQPTNQKSTSQASKQATNQPISQPTNQLINQSTNQQIEEFANRPSN